MIGDVLLAQWLPSIVASSSFLTAIVDIVVLLVLYLITHIILSFILAYVGSERVSPLAISGSHFIVTGGSSGIGLALAVRLAREGGNVTIVARDTTKLQQALQLIKSAAKDKKVRE